MFFGSHVVRMKAGHHLFVAIVLTPSDAPVDGYRMTLSKAAYRSMAVPAAKS